MVSKKQQKVSSKMTLEELKMFLEKDIKKLKRERAKITPDKPSVKNETMRNYLAARQMILMEILGYLQ